MKRQNPRIIPQVLPVRIQKSLNAMYKPASFTCQNSKVSKCHVQTCLFYLSEFESLYMPCTNQQVLPVRIRKSLYAMYNTACFTCQNPKVSICHVQTSPNPYKIPVKIRKSLYAMYNTACFTCQNSEVSKCHVQPCLFYLSKSESLYMPCTNQQVLPVRIRKSLYAMYNFARVTC